MQTFLQHHQPDGFQPLDQVSPDKRQKTIERRLDKYTQRVYEMILSGEIGFANDMSPHAAIIKRLLEETEPVLFGYHEPQTESAQHDSFFVVSRTQYGDTPHSIELAVPNSTVGVATEARELEVFLARFVDRRNSKVYYISGSIVISDDISSEPLLGWLPIQDPT